MDPTISVQPDTISLHPERLASYSRRRPLVDQCTNAWQSNSIHSEKFAQQTSDWFDSIVLVMQRIWAIVRASKLQRLAIACLSLTVIAVLLWQHLPCNLFAEDRAAWRAVNAADDEDGNVFGANKRVKFPGITQVTTMDEKFLPRSSRLRTDTASGRRLIFIGDIHGCMEELEALLAKAKYKPDKDHIITVGDMINKGPSSREVVQFLMEQGASAVRGNHEDRILLTAKAFEGGALTTQDDASRNLPHNEPFETKASRKAQNERKLAKSFTKKQLEWLNACPVILRVGELEPFGDIVTVHGGLVPGISLENQDPMSVMNMRIIDLATHIPSHKHEQKGSIPWFSFWNKYQRLINAQGTIFGHRKSPSTKHTTVVYGHDSRRGLQINKYTKGLDSGCVRKDKLTAWIVSDYGKEEYVHVKCQGERLGSKKADD